MKKRNYQHECIKIWERLAETGGDDKAVVMDNLMVEDYCDNECPACDYVVLELGVNVRAYTCAGKCPIDWRPHAGGRAIDTDCYYSPESPYAAWLQADSPKKRKKYAAEMVEFVEANWKEECL